MGNLSSILRLRDPPRPPDPFPKFVQVNDSVWQLYPPPDSPSVTDPTVEVVFFHGLQVSNYENAYWRTWRSRDGTVVWPKAWLGRKIPGARILSVSYDSSAIEAKDAYGRLDPLVLADNLEADLMMADVGQHCPVVLVGHSLGGIIIKQVLLRMLQKRGHQRPGKYRQKLEKFIRNCEGVFYYSSPQGGSAIADRVIRGFALLQKAVQVFERPGLCGLFGLFLKYIVSLLWWVSTETGDSVIRRFGVPLEQGVWVGALMGLLGLSIAFSEHPIARTVYWARNARMKDVFAFLFLVFVLLGLALVGNILKYSTVSLNPKTASWVMQVIAFAYWVLSTFSLLGLLAHIGDYVRRQFSLNSPIVTLLTRLSTNTAILNREFTMAKHKIGDGGLRTRAMGESLPIIPWLPRVVELASAMQDIDGGFYIAPLANHFDVCKPKNDTTDPIFTYLLSFIGDLVESAVVAAENVEHPEVNQDNVPRGQVLENRLADIQMLSESVWQLYAPVNDPKVDIVFIHGLLKEPSNYDEAFWKTWLSRDGREVWPKDWLSRSLPEARILTISYVSIVRSHPRWTKSSIIGENLIAGNLMQDMFAARVGQNCPVVLVGHSVGGIILKKIYLECFMKKCLLNPTLYPREVDRVENFLRNCLGSFFYSIPFFGSGLGDYAQLILGIKDPLIPLLKTVETIKTDIARVSEEFRLVRNSENMAISTISEGVDTTYMGLAGRIVPEASTRMDSDELYSSDADHFNVCKPKNREDRSFTFLVEFIEKVV